MRVISQPINKSCVRPLLSMLSKIFFMIPSKIFWYIVRFCFSLRSRTTDVHPFQTVIWPQVSVFSACICHLCKLLSIWVFPYISWFQMSFGSCCLVLGLYAKCACLLFKRVISQTGWSLHLKPSSWWAERNSCLLNCAYDTLQVCALVVLAEAVCHWCLTCVQTCL